MRRFVLFGLFALASFALRAADNATTDVNPDEIIRKLAAKEAEFAQARGNYTYRQTVKIQELDPAGNPGGKYELVEDIIFSPEGQRT